MLCFPPTFGQPRITSGSNLTFESRLGFLLVADVRVWRMRTGISITVKPWDRKRLKAILKNSNAPQKHVWRAQIVLLSADGLGTNEIMRQTGKSKTCVWRWQERYMQEDVAGLLRGVPIHQAWSVWALPTLPGSTTAVRTITRRRSGCGARRQMAIPTRWLNLATCTVQEMAWIGTWTRRIFGTVARRVRATAMLRFGSVNTNSMPFAWAETLRRSRAGSRDRA